MLAKGRRRIFTKAGPRPWSERKPPRVRLNLGRPLRGAEIGTSKLTEADVLAIYRLRLSGAAIRAVARQYQLDGATVRDILVGQRWGHLLGKNGAPTIAELLAVPTAEAPTKLSRTDIPKIRALLAAGHQGKDIAKRFGVHKATISDIKQGKIWRNA
jgi:DNA invertase Pin-like site-specific DNA recombinase